MEPVVAEVELEEMLHFQEGDPYPSGEVVGAEVKEDEVGEGTYLLR